LGRDNVKTFSIDLIGYPETKFNTTTTEKGIAGITNSRLKHSFLVGRE